MTIYKLAVAGRYQDRRAIKKVLAGANLEPFGTMITASWLDSSADSDGAMTDSDARVQVETNVVEILNADLLLYFPSWKHERCGKDEALNFIAYPRWSPGRCIDVGIAIGASVPVLIVGTPEPSIYFRGIPSCRPDELRETVQWMLAGRIVAREN